MNKTVAGESVSGVDVAGGASIELTFGDQIQTAEHLIGRSASLPYLAPGFIDLQVNGFAGVDLNDRSTPGEEIARCIRAMFRTGVTRFFPTVITNAFEETAGALRNLAAAKQTLPEGVAMEGFHVEGPHISPEDGPRGAHPRRWVRPPDIDEFRRLQDAAEGYVKLVTLSPEWPEAPRFIETLVREGIVAAIGHTAANAEQIAAAVSAGATMSTHLGNGSHNVLPRHPNYIWDQLAEDRLTASFIGDGIHVPAAFLKAAIRAKGVERSVLVTDAVSPAGSKPGFYRLGEVEVELHTDESVRVRGGRQLAGSSLTMDRGVSRLMQLAGLSLLEAVTMATRNAARAGRVPGRLRGLQPGERADIVQFRVDPQSKDIAVERTWLSGRQVFP
ncbi:MAG: amidohydrolase family protein [Bryobacteraceae bacterium]|nr:amidohydrolase family protein [Bryobacteraceae bacterium]